MITKLQELRFDRAGKPLRVPPKFGGTYEEFAAFVDTLEPIHCSYPNGSCLDPMTKQPCRRTKMAFDSCEVHGKVKARGGLRYAKYLDKNLGTRMAEAHIDDELLNIGHDVEFLSVRLSQLMERLDTGESRQAWQRLSDCWDDMMEAQQQQAAVRSATPPGEEPDAEAIAKWGGEALDAIRAMGKIIQAATKNEETWAESLQLSERIASLKTKETTRRKEAGLTMNIEQALSLVQQLSNIVNDEVEDKNVRATISMRLATLVGLNRIGNAYENLPSRATNIAEPIETERQSKPMSVEDLIRQHVVD